MAAPVSTARTEPTGERWLNGHRSTICHSVDPDINLFELTVGLSEVDNGEPIDITTMWNDDYRAKAERALNDMKPFPFTFSFGPGSYANILAIAGVNGVITRTFPTGTAPLVFFGYFSNFQFEDFVEGEMPVGTCTVVPTNYDRTNWVEAAPVTTSPPPPP